MNPTLQFFVVRSRLGWSVSLDADRLCDHESPETARACAIVQAELARREGERARIVDLSVGGDA